MPGRVGHEAAHLERLQLVAQALASGIDSAEVIEIAVRQAIAALTADGGVVALVEPTGMLAPVRTVGYPAEHVAAFARMRIDLETPLTAAVRENETIWVGSPEEAARRFPALVARRPVSQAWAAAPLTSSGSAFGVLGVSFSTPREQTDVDVGFLRLLADLSAAALGRGPHRPSPWPQSLVDAIGQPVIVIDAGGRVRRTNVRATQEFGFPDGGLTDVDVEEILPGLFRGTDTALDSKSGAGRRRVVALTGVRSDESRFPVEVSIDGADGPERGLRVAIVRDMSESQAHEAYTHAVLQARTLARSSLGSRLSGAEMRILRLLCQGQTNAEIAEAAFVGTETVKSHLSSIYSKLGVSTRSEAIAKAFRTPSFAALLGDD